MNAKLLEERTIFHVGTPARVERIRFTPDFHMTPDAGLRWVYQLQPERFPAGRPFAGVCREHALASQRMPVTLDQPVGAFAGVPVSGPTPEAVPQDPFHLLERLLRHNVTMVVGPAPNDGIEMTNQVGLTGSAMPMNKLPHLFQKVVRVFLGRFDEQLVVVFAEVLSEEVESLFDRRDAGFLWRELQAPVAQKLLDQWPDFLFQHVLVHAGDDEVIRVSHEVHFRAVLPPIEFLRWEVLLEQSLQTVQCQVGQRRRDNPALWRACLCGEEDSIFHEPGFEPFAQHFLVGGNVAEHPFVGDVIKTSTNVALQHPRRTVLAGQHEEALANGVSRASARPKTIGVFVRRGFRDGKQRQQVQCLHGAVFHRRDAQRSQLPVGFRNVNTSQRLWLITVPPQRADGFVFGRRGVPYFPVHPRRSFALIVRHSFHGQGFAGKRAGEQPLQSFHFVPAPRLSCLDDTRLQSSDIASTLGPVNLVPGVRFAGGCTRGLLCVHLPFPPVKVLRVLSSRMTNWKSARLHGRTMLQSLSAPLQSGLGFLQSPLPAIPSAFLADALAPKPGRNVGFAMLSSSDTNELAPAFHTGSLECPCVPCVQQNTRLRAFWLEPDSRFGSLGMTALMAVHLHWAFHPACPPDRLEARSRGDHLTMTSSQVGKDVVSAASNKTVTSFAGADRLLRTESQVWFTHFISCQTITVTPSFRTQALPLNKLRFWGSRMSRGISAQKLLRARSSVACSWTVRGLGLDVDTDKSRARPRHGLIITADFRSHGQSVFTSCARPSPCSRTARCLPATAKNGAALAWLLRALKSLKEIRGKAY